MNILDENITDDQRQLLQKWHIPVHHIGYDLGHQGMKDAEIIPLLHSLRRPTFFTRDLDFCKFSLCHAKYCLVYLGIEKNEVATFVRRLLKHLEFDTQTKRMGKIIRVSHVGLSVWHLHAEIEIKLEWAR